MGLHLPDHGEFVLQVPGPAGWVVALAPFRDGGEIQHHGDTGDRLGDSSAAVYVAVGKSAGGADLAGDVLDWPGAGRAGVLDPALRGLIRAPVVGLGCCICFRR